MMSDTEKDLAVHVAVCEERYSHIAQLLKDGEKIINTSKMQWQKVKESGHFGNLHSIKG
jgi:uncharacterized protein YqiB (DUF1249 family)